MARKIGKRAKTAKKYADLRAKQRLANQYLYGSKEWLKVDHKERKNALARKRQFYKTRGLRNPSKLSFKNLTTGDLRAYETLLDSIIENTYLNPDKYQKFKESQTQNGDKAFEKMFDSFEEWDEFRNSDIFSMLIELGLDPSALYRYIQEWYDGGYTIDEFVEGAQEFIKEYGEGNYTIDEFFEFMDNWKSRREQEMSNKTDTSNGQEMSNKMDTSNGGE